MGRGKRKTEADYHSLARGWGVEWIDKALPKNTDVKTKWRCGKRHERLATYHSIKKGNCCPHCSGMHPKEESDYHLLAKEHGFEWIGKALPKNVNTKTKWRCGEGHERVATYSEIKVGKGCPHCPRSWAKRELDYHLLAKERGIEWIDSVLPKNVVTKTMWRCGEGHEWPTTYKSIKRSKSAGGCPHCPPSWCKRELDYHLLAKERGFEWIGESLPKRTTVETKWRCGKGHEWDTTYDSIQKGTNCSICYEFKGEKAVRQTLNTLGIHCKAQATFEGCKSKRPLPFDFSFTLCWPGLVQNFLVEYDGEQHYKANDAWGGRNALRRTQRRDKIKTAFAEKYDFVLIRIPYTVPLENISTYLIEAIAKAAGKSFGEIATMGKQNKPKKGSLLDGFEFPQTAGVQLPLLPMLSR